MHRFAPAVVGALLIVLLVGLAACGSAAKSGIEGTAIAGEKTASPTPQPWPSNMTILVHRNGPDGTVVSNFHPAASGSFRVDLPPGYYVLVPSGPGIGLASATPVAVGHGTYTHVTLWTAP